MISRFRIADQPLPFGEIARESMRAPMPRQRM